MKTSTTATVLLFLGFAGVALAATPPALLHFQGVLRDADGNPLNGPVIMNFQYYNAAEGGELLLFEGHDAVQVVDGLFDVRLGEGFLFSYKYPSLPTMFGGESEVFLELQVEADPPMTPRIRIVANGYALNADMLDGRQADAFVGTSAEQQTVVGELIVTDAEGRGTTQLAPSPPGYTAGVFSNAKGAYVEIGTTQQVEGEPGMGIYVTGTGVAADFDGAVLVGGHLALSNVGAEVMLGDSGRGIDAQGDQFAGLFRGDVEVRGDVDVTGGLVGVGIRDSGGQEWTFESGYFEYSSAWVELAAELQAEGGPTMGIQASGSLYAGNFLGDLRAEGRIIAEDGVRFPDGSVQVAATTHELCLELTGSADCDLAAAIQDAALPSNNLRLVTRNDVGDDAWVSTAIGADGNPVISFYNQASADLQVAHCFDRSCSSVEINTVDAAGDVGRYNALVISDGTPVIGYYDATNGDLKVAWCHDLGCKYSDTWTQDSTGDVGRYTSIAIGGLGYPIVAYHDATDGDLRFIGCSDAHCAGVFTPKTLASSGDTGRYTSIAYDGVRPIVSFLGQNDHVWLALCQDASCTAPPALVLITDEVNNSYQTAVLAGADGNPTVAWGYNVGVEGSPFSLEVVHCLDAACSSMEGGALDFATSGRPEPGVSMLLGAEGYPIASWRRADGLHVAHCHDAACSGDETVLLLDAGNVLGNITSIALAPNGKPTVAYTGVDGSLKIATNLTFPENGGVSTIAALEPTPVDRHQVQREAGAGREPYRRSPSTTWVGTPVDDEGNVYAKSFRSSAPDLASVVRVADPVAAGDVLVIDAERPGLMKLGDRPDDTAVFGVVVADPGVALGAHLPAARRRDELSLVTEDADAGAVESQEVAVAVSGTALCNVDAGYGEIRPGDLLTTSPTAGHAMRTLEPRPGTILGKALEPLATGTGRIRILVTLL